jgi:signal transduction histidine kinase
MVSVEDTGRGIDPKDIDQVFNPLFTTKPHGMGMGLSICRSIIEAHEGQLWASPNRSQGAVFQFTLPADTAMSAASAPTH